MKTQEIVKHARLIELQTKKILDNIGIGSYASTFKGQGMEFSEVREYMVGDDTRNIDWNITAKTGKPHTKKFIEERERTLILAIDISASKKFSSQKKSKHEFVALIASLLGFYAISNQDLVSLVLFSDQIELFLPAKKGKQHILRMIHQILETKPQSTKTNVNVALEHISKVIKKKSIIFLISDFYTPDFLTTLKPLKQKHQVIALEIHDPREKAFPKVGFIELVDAETNQIALVDSSLYATQKSLDLWQKKQNQFKQILTKHNVPSISLEFQEDFLKSIQPLIAFFKRQSQPKAR